MPDTLSTIKTSGLQRKTEFFEFQEKAFSQLLDFLHEKKCAWLLWEMGTGKTIATLYLYKNLCDAGLVDHAIIICPKMLVNSWVDQLKEHTGSNNFMIWKNNKSKNYQHELSFFSLNHAKIFIVNTEAFQMKTTALESFINRICTTRRVYMALDESSMIKSPGANRTKRILELAPLAKYRVALTGTEVTKNVTDLYAQGEYLQRFFWSVKNYYVFRAKYAIFEDVYASGGRLIKNAKYVGAKDIDELKEKIASCSVRLLKKDCLDLPEKMYQTIELDMPEALRKLYDKLKKYLMAEYDGAELTVANKVALFIRFRQLSGHFFPQNDGSAGYPVFPNYKLDAIKDELEDTDQQAVIWCSFTDEIEMLNNEIEDSFAIYGETPQKDRANFLSGFAEGDFKVLILSSQLGSFGLNLQFCNLVYYYSNPLRADLRWQSEDRFHRIGMKNPVLYKDLIYKNSIDERVVQLLKEKNNLREILRANILKGENGDLTPDFGSMNNEQFFKIF